MLDEAEFELIHQVYWNCIRAVKNDRIENHLPLSKVDFWKHYRPVREAYSSMTGAPEMHHDAIMYHRLALYGPPCENCGKPLRTPKAKMCVACGRAG